MPLAIPATLIKRTIPRNDAADAAPPNQLATVVPWLLRTLPARVRRDPTLRQAGRGVGGTAKRKGFVRAGWTNTGDNRFHVSVAGEPNAAVRRDIGSGGPLLKVGRGIGGKWPLQTEP